MAMESFLGLRTRVLGSQSLAHTDQTLSSPEQLAVDHITWDAKHAHLFGLGLLYAPTRGDRRRFR